MKKSSVRGPALLTFLILFVPAIARAHGQLHLLIAGLTRQISRDPGNAQLYLQRGELYREHQDWKSAEADYQRATRLDPALQEVEFCRARMLADSSQLAEARKHFDQYIADHPQDGRAYLQRARLEAGMDQLASAVSDYSRGLDLLPSPEFFLERARLLVTAGKRNDALRGLDQGIRKIGPSAPLQSLALELELAQTNYAGALMRVQTIIDSAPRKETWLARRGEIELLAGRTNDAKTSFEASLRAVKSLPRRLQQNQPMVDLSLRLNESLKKLAAPRRE